MFFLRHFNWNRKWGQCRIWKKFSNIPTRKLRKIWNLWIKPFGKNMLCPSIEIISVRLKNHATTNFTAMDHAPMSIISRWDFSCFDEKINLFRIVMNRSCSLPIEVRFARRTSQGQDKAGWLTIWMRIPTHLRRNQNQKRFANGPAAVNVGRNLLPKTRNMTV